MFFKIVFITLTVTIVSAKLNALSGSRNYDYFEDCIDIILTNIFKKDISTATILRYRLKSTLKKWPAIKMNNFTTIKIWSRFLPTIYLIREELNNTGTLLKQFKKHGLLAPRSWYIYVSNFSDSSNFSFLTKEYIANVFAINQNFDIFTIEPYRYENANLPENRPFKIGTCKNISEIPFSKYFNKYPRKWRNTTVYEYFRLAPPFTTESFSGLEDKLFNLLKEELGFKNQRRKVPKLKNTTQILMQEEQAKQELKEKKIDIFGGLFVLKSDDSTMDYSMTPSYILRTIVWMTPNGPPVSEWWRITHIFSFQFYLGWILLLSVLSLIAKCFFGTSIALMLSVTYKILLEYPVINNLHLKSFPLRVFAGASVLAMLTVSALFKNSLLIINATTIRTQQLESLDDILTKSNLILAGYVSKNLKDIFSSSKPGESQINFNKMIKCPFNEVCLNRTAFKKDTAVLTEKLRALYYYIPLWYRDENGESLLHLGSEIVKTEGIHMIFSKGYPLSRRFSKIILRANAAGWFRQQLDSLAIADDITLMKFHHKTRGVSLKSISFIFYLWAGGIALALIRYILR